MNEMMIVPTLSDVVRNVADTLDRVIVPALSTQSQRSVLATIGHLLRHTALRAEMEGQILLDEARRLRLLLSQVRDHFARGENAAPLVEAIGTTLDAPADPEIYPSLDIMAREVAVLRKHAADALVAIREAAEKGPDPARDVVHQALRDYIGWQLAQEAKIVEPGFRGHGPRR